VTRGEPFARGLAEGALTQAVTSKARALIPNPSATPWLSEQVKRAMTIESVIRLLAGSLILISLALYQFVSPWGLVLAVFIGLNLAQSALSGFCPAEMILKRLGVGGSCGGPHGET